MYDILGDKGTMVTRSKAISYLNGNGWGRKTHNLRRNLHHPNYYKFKKKN